MVTKSTGVTILTSDKLDLQLKIVKKTKQKTKKVTI